MAYDVVNAATPVAYDTYASGYIGTETFPGNVTLGTITPSTANGLIFATVGTLEGSIHGSLGIGQYFDAPYYDGELDWDNMINNDGYCHYYNGDTSPVTFAWVFQATGGTPGMNVAITAFAGATSASIPTPTPAPSAIRPQHPHLYLLRPQHPHLYLLRPQHPPTFTYSNPNTHTFTYSNPNTHTFTYSNPNTHTCSDLDTHTHAKTSSSVNASLIASVGSLQRKPGHDAAPGLVEGPTHISRQLLRLRAR